MIKPLINIILVVFFCQSIFSQKRIYIDENNDTISKNSFGKKWRNKDLLLSTWHYKGNDGILYQKLKNDLYLLGKLDYKKIKLWLKNITGKNIENSVILLEYIYKDDLCSSYSTNNWTRRDILRRKTFFNPILDNYFKDKDIVFLSFYEQGIILKNNPKSKKEYFFSDVNNFLKKIIFKSPTLCGSFALIKPNGETLIRNGEYRPDLMAEHLKPKNWNQFFNK